MPESMSEDPCATDPAQECSEAVEHRVKSSRLENVASAVEACVGSAASVSKRIRPRRVEDEIPAGSDLPPRQHALSGFGPEAPTGDRLIQDTNFIHWRWDAAKDRFSHVSREALRLGYPLEQWCQPGFYTSILHPADREAVLKRRADYLEAWLPFRSQHRVLDVNQNTVWLDDIVFVDVDSNDQLEVHGIFIDITHRRESIEQVRQSDSLHRALFECLGNGFVVQDLDDVIIRCNSAAGRILGMSPSELIGRSSRDPNWRGQLEDGTWIDASQHPSMITLRTGEPQRNVIFSVARADGKRIWLRVNTQPVRNRDGSMRAVMCEFADISKQVATQKSLQAAEHQAWLKREQLELTLDAADIGVWTWLPESDELVCDERCLAVLNLAGPSSKRTHFDWLSQTHPDDRANLATTFQEMGSGEPGKPTCSFRIAVGEEQNRWIQMTARVPAFEAMRTAMPISGIVQDVTAPKERELELARLRDEADRANHAKSVFLANVSHEIRTPLTAILGYTEMLRQDRDIWRDVQETDRALATVENAGKHLLTVINDILDLTKIEAGHSTIQIERANPLAILLEVESLLRPRAEDKGLHYETRLQSVIPPELFTDGTRLKQVILNLVGNAVKFTCAGFIRVFVRQSQDHSSTWLEIDVVDSGPGLEPDDQERIFSSFVQADTSMNRQYSGTGLGLTISRRLMEAMGGSVELIDSQRGIGSTFRIRLPMVVSRDDRDALATAAPAALRTASESSAPRSPDSESRSTNIDRVAATDQLTLSGRILVVDDGPDNLNLIAYLLRRSGADVVAASSGEEAIGVYNQARHQPQGGFDLVVTDVQMPGMNGLELAQRIRSLDETIPIFALTAHAMRDDAELCLSAGCCEFIPKPIDQTLLIDCCYRWLSKTNRLA